MSRLSLLAVTAVLLSSSVGCMQSRWAGYGGGGCCQPGGAGVYGAPGGAGFAPQGNLYSPTGMGVPMNGPTAYMGPYSAPAYGGVPTTAYAPIEQYPTY